VGAYHISSGFSLMWKKGRWALTRWWALAWYFAAVRYARHQNVARAHNYVKCAELSPHHLE